MKEGTGVGGREGSGSLGRLLCKSGTGGGSKPVMGGGVSPPLPGAFLTSSHSPCTFLRLLSANLLNIL